MAATLARLLHESARLHPERAAVEDPKSGIAATYDELRDNAVAFADVLRSNGARPGDRIGICAWKSVNVVEAIFGILDAGMAYVPVDAGAPAQRTAGILEDCAVTFVLTERSCLSGLRKAWSTETLEELHSVGDNLVLVRGVATNPTTSAPQDQSADGIAYILYTSGSTGKAKGVVHTHRSALSFIDWCSDTFEPQPTDRFSSHAPFHFDLSILDIYLPIKHGATLVLIDEEAGKQPATLAPLIAESRITFWYSTPSILRLLAEYGRLAQFDFSALRFVFFAGEVFPLKHLRAIKEFWSTARYFNLYGPTETNVCTSYELPPVIPEERSEPFPIGFDCSGDVTMVVSDGAPAEFGEEGELLVTGGSVMQGYWNMPERTEESFFTDADGVRWYRTGDVVKESRDEGYLFLGRRDRMVKRRGYRVELGEIEAALYRHAMVDEAAVIAVPDEANGVLIKSFLTLTTSDRPSLVQMKMFCAEQLPAYMIPDRFIFSDTLPKTSTGKIDYQTLKRGVS